MRWLSVVVAHAFIDLLRARPDLQRRRTAGGRTLTALEHVPLDEARLEGAALDPSGVVEVRRILANLLDSAFPEAQRRALLLWLDGHDAGEIAEALGLADAGAADRLLHAARQRLRRRFERNEP